MGRIALLLLLILLISPASAQGPYTQHAGLVVDFGDGNVYTACVDLGADGQATGEEVLRASGLDVLIEYSPMGGAVCKIDSQGCNYPSQPCWCQCLSSPCVYWAYHHLVDGRWSYSSRGASNYTVRGGDVEGWAWGAGSGAGSQGAEPPVKTFDEICAAPTATPTPTATPAATPSATPTTFIPPTAIPTATPTPALTATPTATATATPTATATQPLQVTPTWTWTAIAAPTPTATPTWTAAAETPTATPVDPAPELPTSFPSPSPAAESSVSALPPPALSQVFLPNLARGLVDVAADQPNVLSSPTAEEEPTPTPTLQWLAAAVHSGASGGPASDAPIDRRPPPELPRQQSMTPPAGRGVSVVTTDSLAFLLWVLILALVWTALRFLGAGRSPFPVLSGWLRFGLTIIRRRALPAFPILGRPVQGPTVAQAGLARAFSPAIYALAAGIGVLALLYPFLGQVAQAASPTREADAPFLLTLLVGLIFLALLAEVQGTNVSAKRIALLGVLVSINSVLRFIEVGIPGPGGFSPIFFLIVLTGYVFGGRFGFLMGALTLLVSGLITGGIGPWLPAQMFTAGWVGLSAPLLRPLVRISGGRPAGRAEVAALAVFSALWGLAFGFVMNLWFWPFMTGPAGQSYGANLALADILSRYLAFYLATSLVWDSMRLLGNLLLVVAFGAATLRALRRFQQRFDFVYDLEPAGTPPQALPEMPGAARQHPRPQPGGVFAERRAHAPWART